MIVNVCPAATTTATPERVWNVIADIDRWRDWTGAVVLSVAPPGAMRPGQVVTLGAPRLRFLKFTIDVGELDPAHRWIDLVARFPFGIVNHEHLTLAETEAGGTLIRFN
ncbi:MAG TPA: SRPBCC family protein [Candidatus Dormibacteraeota bacterium]|nr:SRPBCC family protein [Candidatus Dormibacteraeota bacterium]